MYRIKKIKILPLAYTVTLIYFILGLLLGIFLAIIRTNPSFNSLIGQDLVVLTLIQIILLYPVAYSVVGFVIGIIVGYIPSANIFNIQVETSTISELSAVISSLRELGDERIEGVSRSILVNLDSE